MFHDLNMITALSVGAIHQQDILRGDEDEKQELMKFKLNHHNDSQYWSEAQKTQTAFLKRLAGGLCEKTKSLSPVYK